MRVVSVVDAPRVLVTLLFVNLIVKTLRFTVGHLALVPSSNV